ncbi:MAG: NYN domain-containing protein, partial [Lachnospiraceae bacterium]|nr:NYN domain-containing protein [Lachnospiraceae bacterium]
MFEENENLKIAILIDAENISYKYMATIMKEVAVTGTVKYKRIYGNFASAALASWENAIAENAMIPVQQYSNTKGKNASDSALIIDAMDLLYTGGVDAFCLVTSDSDFTRLATRLRESEKYVFGMGERKTAKSFINACNKFVYLDLLYHQDMENEKQPEKKKETAPSGRTIKTLKNTAAKKGNDVVAAVNKKQQTPVPTPVLEEDKDGSGANVQTIKSAIVALIDEKSNDEGWVFSGVLGNMLNQRYPDFDVRNFGFKKFVPFIKSLGNFEIKKTSSGDADGVDLVYIRN